MIFIADAGAGLTLFYAGIAIHLFIFEQFFGRSRTCLVCFLAFRLGCFSQYTLNGIFACGLGDFAVRCITSLMASWTSRYVGKISVCFWDLMCDLLDFAVGVLCAVDADPWEAKFVNWR